MKKAKLIFSKCVLDSKDFGSDEKNMISRVYYDLYVGSRAHRNLHTDIKQPAGSDLEGKITKMENVPDDTMGIDNKKKIYELIEKYYRSLGGEHPNKLGLGLTGNIRVWSLTVNKEKTEEFEIAEDTLEM